MRWIRFCLIVGFVLVEARAGWAAIDHGPWDRLLKRYVDENGRVAYRDLQKRDGAILDSYLKTLSKATIEGMGENEEKALWINAYNAVIVKGVLDGYTAEGFFSRKRLFSWYTVPVAGKDRTPDEIEHEILRKKFDDPRIHFTIVCASSSCPKLRQEAYVAERLDEQLNDATRAFINDPSRNQITSQQVALSMIFKWFAADFIQQAGSVPRFVQQYVDEDKRTALEGEADELDYLEYSWVLNAQDGQRLS